MSLDCSLCNVAKDPEWLPARSSSAAHSVNSFMTDPSVSRLPLVWQRAHELRAPSALRPTSAL